MRALPWLIAAGLLALNSIQMDNYQGDIKDYKDERDQARAEFQDGAKIFWDAQAENGMIHEAYLYELNWARLTIKQQRLVIDAYEAQLKYYRKVYPEIFPAAAIPE